jgi:hypothetical protein
MDCITTFCARCTAHPTLLGWLAAYPPQWVGSYLFHNSPGNFWALDSYFSLFKHAISLISESSNVQLSVLNDFVSKWQCVYHITFVYKHCHFMLTIVLRFKMEISLSNEWCYEVENWFPFRIWAGSIWGG